MTIVQILILAALAVIIGLLSRGRALALAGVSAFALFWLAQPYEGLPSLPFWLQTFTIFIVVLIWLITAPSELRRLRDNWPALAVVAVAILLASLVNQLPAGRILAVSTPGWNFVLAALAAFMAGLLGLSAISRFNRLLAVLAIAALLGLFLILKSPLLSAQIIELFSSIRGRELDPRAAQTLVWLGFSYLAFRLIHVLRDWQEGLLPPVRLDEFICYVIFFPSIIAGPIDRLERFTRDLRTPTRLANEDWLIAGQRLASGLFKKFVLADWLAWLSISDALVGQARTGGWLWLFLYAYTFRLYLDFSGYTDIAIGIARLAGIRLPENFSSPFLKSNLTLFWNSWHITLTQWFRAYVFNPLTRYFRMRKRPLPVWFTLLLTQIFTMGLIGLWHGVTWNFLLWGVWNGAGLFLQNRWSEFIRVRFPNWGAATPFARGAITVTGVLLTFHYFALSLLFFSLSTPQISISALLKLFGVS